MKTGELIAAVGGVLLGGVALWLLASDSEATSTRTMNGKPIEPEPNPGDKLYPRPGDRLPTQPGKVPPIPAAKTWRNDYGGDGVELEVGRVYAAVIDRVPWGASSSDVQRELHKWGKWDGPITVYSHASELPESWPNRKAQKEDSSRFWVLGMPAEPVQYEYPPIGSKDPTVSELWSRER